MLVVETIVGYGVELAQGKSIKIIAREPGCLASRFVRSCALTRRRFLMNGTCSRARDSEDRKSYSIGCWRRTSKRRLESDGP